MWTYSGDPSQSAKDQVRFLVGDTNEKEPLLQDGEIRWLLNQYQNTPLNAAIRACETIISKLSRAVDESVGRVSISFSQRRKGYADTLLMLRQRLAMEDAVPYCGGISVTDKYTQDMNTDRVRPDFTKHMMENDQIAPWTTQTELGLWLAFDG